MMNEYNDLNARSRSDVKNWRHIPFKDTFSRMCTNGPAAYVHKLTIVFWSAMVALQGRFCVSIWPLICGTEINQTNMASWLFFCSFQSYSPWCSLVLNAHLVTAIPNYSQFSAVQCNSRLFAGSIELPQFYHFIES